MVTNFDVGDDLPLLVYLSSNSLVILKEKVRQHEWKKKLEIKSKIFSFNPPRKPIKWSKNVTKMRIFLRICYKKTSQQGYRIKLEFKG